MDFSWRMKSKVGYNFLVGQDLSGWDYILSRVPKEIYILGKKWQVVHKWRLEDEGVMCDGLADVESRTIYLCHGLGNSKFQIFLHEFIHAVLAEAGVYHAGLSEEVEEIISHNLSKELESAFIFRNRPNKK